ncbi:MAG: YbjQ family protein [bacterium]|nr:YbjQ family protein [bacterium]
MLITTTHTIPGKEVIEILGLAQGSTVRAKHIGKDIFASLKQIVGGELKGYTEMMDEARVQALQRMTAEAEKLGADAVINVRFGTASIMDAAAEVLAYGMAVKVK